MRGDEEEMNKIVLCGTLLLSACAAMPASREDMDRLGARIERAVAQEARSVSSLPQQEPPPYYYDRTETLTTTKGEQLPDGSTAESTTWQLRVDGDLRFGVNDPMLHPAPQESLLRLPAARGSNRQPFFRAPMSVQPTPEQLRRLMPSPGYCPPVEHGR